MILFPSNLKTKEGEGNVGSGFFVAVVDYLHVKQAGQHGESHPYKTKT